VNNNTLYTRCPTCSTAFKVTDELLELAGGKVRCGACLAVFQATDYMLRPSSSAQPHSKQATGHASEQQPDQTLMKTEDPIIDLAEDIPPNNPAEQPTASELEIENAETDTDTGKLETREPENKIDLDPSLDESLAKADRLLSTLDELGADTAAQESIQESVGHQPVDPKPSTHNEDVVAEIENLEINPPDTLEEFNYENEAFDFDDKPSDFDKDFNEQPVEESITTEEPSIEEAPKTEQKEFNLDSDDPEISEEDITISIDEEINTKEDPTIEISEWDEDDDQLEELSEQALDPDYNDTSSDEISSSAVDEFEDQLDYLEENFEEEFDDAQADASEEDLDELSDQLHEQMQQTDTDPDPLDEFDNIVKEEKKGVRSKLIIASIGILLSIFIWQFWSNRQSLAWSDSWGGTVKAVCSYLPCNLKPKRDVSKIKLLQRQLSPDEEKENFLDIKVLLVNEADFAQPYPTIKIIFSNKNGEQVSKKSFAPKDYLEADASTALMPSGSEVHIHFKTEVTHPDALGFEFIFE